MIDSRNFAICDVPWYEDDNDNDNNDNNNNDKNNANDNSNNDGNDSNHNLNNKEECTHTKTSLLRRLQAQTLPDAAPPTGKIHPFSKIAVTLEPRQRF